MRAIFSALMLLLLTACGPATEPVAEAPEPTVVPPAPLTDQEVTGIPAVDSIRRHQAAIDKLFTTGMLQQKNVTYACEGIRGTAEVYRQGGRVMLVRNRYNDGDNRTITDRFYYDDDQLIHQFSETLRWEFDGSTQIDQNGNAVPGIVNHVSRYRYYVQDGKIVKFLKRQFEFTSLEHQPAEEVHPLLEMTPPTALPYRTELATAAIRDGAVDCAVFR